MLKQKIIICALICFASCSYAQLVKSYSETIATEFTDHSTTKYIIEFSLCEDGKYELLLNDTYSSKLWNYDPTWPISGDDDIIYYGISEGKYEIRNDTLFFTDSDTHHQIVYTLDHFYMKPVKTFPFLQNIIFTDEQKDYTYYSYDCYRFSNDVPIKNEKRIKKHKKENTQKYLLETNRYNCGALTIDLNKDAKFEISFISDLSESKIDLLLFSGIWSRKGNILTLWDTNFEHQFYGLIYEDGVELLLNRWWKDLIFKKI